MGDEVAAGRGIQHRLAVAHIRAQSQRSLKSAIGGA
jgi:hypothetical protein